MANTGGLRTMMQDHDEHPDCLVSAWHALRGNGFSAAAAQCVSCPGQGSTSTINNGHWKKWYFWC